MRKRQEEGKTEDSTLLAGWMYADLFLAMMVIFLATVTFIPEYIGNLDQTATNSAYNYQEIYKKPLAVVLDINQPQLGFENRFGRNQILYLRFC